MRCRQLSSLFFVSGNIFITASNFAETNWLQLLSGLVFIIGSITLFLSASHHRWLFPCALSTLGGFVLAAFSSPGPGDMWTRVGLIAGVAGSLLMFRGGLQRETGRQYPLPGFLNLIDRFPLASAAVIEGVSSAFLVAGAMINQDIRLTIAASLWLVAYLFLFLSDEFLRPARPH